MNAMKVLLSALFFTVAVSSFGQQPKEDEGKYKRFWLANKVGQKTDKDVFYIARGNIKIGFSISEGQSWTSSWQDVSSIDLFQGSQSITTVCSMRAWERGFKGNLDLVKEPDSYSDGFSEQDGIITYKANGECLHINISRCIALKTMTLREFGLYELVGQKIGQIRFHPIARIRRSATASSEEVVSIEDSVTLPMLFYKYRYWKDGKEVRYQPNKNRFGTLGTYGDDEDCPEKKLDEEIAANVAKVAAKAPVPFTKAQSAKRPSSSAKVSTVLAPKDGLSMVGGFKISVKLIPDMKGGLLFNVEDAKELTLAFAKVEEKDLSSLDNPAKFSFSPPPAEGIVAPFGEAFILMAKSASSDDAKYLALRTVRADTTHIVYQCRFWSSQEIQILAQKPGQKTF